MDIDSNTGGQRQGEQTTNRYTADNVRALLAELYSLGYGFSHIAKQVGLPVSWLSQLVRAKRTLCSPTLLEAIGKLAEKSLSVAREISVPPVAPRRLRIEAGLSLTAAVEHLKKEGFTRGAGQLAAIEKRPRGSWFRFAPEEWRELAGLYARYKPIAEEIRERYEKLNPYVAFCKEIAARLRVSAEELGLFLAQKRGLAPDRLEGLRRVILELEGETWLRDITPAWVEKQLQRRRESQAKAAGRLARQLRLGQHYIRGTALAKFSAGKRKLPYAIAKALWKYLCSDESNSHNQQPAGMEVVAALRQRCHNLGRYVNLRCEIVRRCKSKISKNTLKWFWIHGGNLRPRDCALVNEALDAIQNESPWLNVLNPEWLNNQMTILKLSLTEAAKLLRRKLGHRGKIHQTLVAFLAGKRRLYYPMAKAIWELFGQTDDSGQPPVTGDVIRRIRERYRKLGRYVMIAGEIARRTQPRLHLRTIVWFADRAFTCELLPSEVNVINEALDKLESEYPWLGLFTPDWARQRIRELGLKKTELWKRLSGRLRSKGVAVSFEAFLARGRKVPFRYAAALVEMLGQPSQATSATGNGTAGDANQLVRRRGRKPSGIAEVELEICDKAKQLGLIKRGRKIKDDNEIPRELIPLIQKWYTLEKRKKYSRIRSVLAFRPAECLQVIRRSVHDVRKRMRNRNTNSSG